MCRRPRQHGHQRGMEVMLGRVGDVAETQHHKQRGRHQGPTGRQSRQPAKRSEQANREQPRLGTTQSLPDQFRMPQQRGGNSSRTLSQLGEILREVHIGPSPEPGEDHADNRRHIHHRQPGDRQTGQPNGQLAGLSLRRSSLGCGGLSHGRWPGSRLGRSSLCRGRQRCGPRRPAAGDPESQWPQHRRRILLAGQRREAPPATAPPATALEGVEGGQQERNLK